MGSIDLVTDHRNYVNYDTKEPGAGRCTIVNYFVMPRCYRFGGKNGTGRPERKQHMSQMTYVLDFTGHSAK
jgi:hypothetical protein